MLRVWFGGVVAAWMVLAARGASAQNTGGQDTAWAPRSVAFSVGAVNYSLPLPAGYCLGSEADPQNYAATVAANPGAVILTTYEPCADAGKIGAAPPTQSTPPAQSASPAGPLPPPGAEYTVVMAPKNAVNTKATLAQILPVFDPQRDAKLDFGQALHSLSAATGADVALAATPHLHGHDAVCGFATVDAKASVKRDGLSVDVVYTAALCATVIGQRTLVIANYYIGALPPGMADRQMRYAEAVARSIRLTAAPSPAVAQLPPPPALPPVPPAPIAAPILIAPPPPPTSVTFQIGKVGFAMPFPKGRCLAQTAAPGAYAELVKQNDSVQLLEAFSLCPWSGGTRPMAMAPLPDSDLSVIVTLKKTADRRIDLATFLSRLGAVKAIDLKSHDVDRDMTAALGAPASVEGAMQMQARDDVCGFMVASMKTHFTVQKVAGEARMTMAVCLTVIGERVVMVMRYQLADATPAEEARLMRDAEALATSITVTTPAEPTDGPG